MADLQQSAVLKLEAAIAQWDRRNTNHSAGAIALQRLDDVVAEYNIGGNNLYTLLCENFNDRLLALLLKAI